MNSLHLLKGAWTVVAALGFALAVTTAPAFAAPSDPCKGKPADRPPECTEDAGGGGNALATFEALLAGDLVNAALDPDTDTDNACGTSGATVGPFDDPDKTAAMVAEFERRLFDFDAMATDGPVDQLYGFGAAVLGNITDDVLQVKLLNTPDGMGAVNRVLLPGPPDRDGNQFCGDGNDTETIHGHVWLFLAQAPDCESGADICVTGYRILADLDNHKNVAATSAMIDAVDLETDDCAVTVVPLFARFDMIQQGKKGVNHGSLSVGKMYLRALPADGVCPLTRS